MINKIMKIHGPALGFFWCRYFGQTCKLSGKTHVANELHKFVIGARLKPYIPILVRNFMSCVKRVARR